MKGEIKAKRTFKTLDKAVRSGTFENYYKNGQIKDIFGEDRKDNSS